FVTFSWAFRRFRVFLRAVGREHAVNYPRPLKIWRIWREIRVEVPGYGIFAAWAQAMLCAIPLPACKPFIRAKADRTTASFREGFCMSDTADRVKKIVVEHLGVEAEKVTPDASFIDDLGADS